MAESMSEPTCVVASGDRLGEGPCWSPAEGRLYWFDIKGRRLRWLSPHDGQTGDVALPMRASAAAARSGGGLIMATEVGLATFEPRSRGIHVVQPIALERGFRTNDGKVDPAGDFWWSTMDDDGGRRPGDVYRTKRSGVTEHLLSGVHIPNTISFSADGGRLYLTDSRLQTIFAYNSPDLSQRIVFAETRGQVATPDGGALDAEGYLWNAQWGGARLVRYTPDGRVDRVVPLPVDQPTSCAFGGPDLSILYVTSAWDGMTARARQRQPLAGGLFALQPGVAGLPLPLYEGTFPVEESPHGR